MLQFLPISEDNTIAIRASGKLTHEDYQAFLPQLEKKIEKKDKVSILFELENFVGWDLKAAKDDFNFGMKHLDNWERLAVVGDKAWERWMTAIAKPFLPSGEIRYFDHENLKEAWDWLREPDNLKKVADNLQAYKTIIAPIDFSLSAKHASKRAIELANLYDATVTLVHVVQEITPYPSYYGDEITGYAYDPVLLENQNKELLAQAKKEMENFVSSLQTKVKINTQVMSGDIEKTIMSLIAAANADLVVLGSSKKSGFAKLLGSVPQYIQNHAHCETLVVPLVI